jgi:hypothetical protein
MKVTIGIPVFNCEAWIATAIQSALDQTWPEKEVIVVDDGSTDRSASICRSFGSQITFVQQPNQGGNAARNAICRLSSSPWIQFLDADDYLKADKIRSQIEGISDLADTDVLCSATIYQHWANDRVTRETVTPLEQECDWFALWLTWSMPQTGGCLWRKKAIEKIGGWNEQVRCNQEYELYFRAFKDHLRFRTAGDALAVYRLWSEDTVCRRDKKEVVFGITHLIQEFLRWLKEQGKLTAQYQNLAARSCFALARTLALKDLRVATDYYEARKKEGLILPVGASAPTAYRLALKVLGFQTAERIAYVRRKIGHDQTAVRY